jgi:hypothetical protein
VCFSQFLPTRIIAIASSHVRLGNYNKGYFGVYYVRSRYAPSGCSPPYRGLLLPSFQPRAFSRRVTPTTVGYNYTAKLRIAVVGLAPTRPADSFAAPVPYLCLCLSLSPSLSVCKFLTHQDSYPCISAILSREFFDFP